MAGLAERSRQQLRDDVRTAVLDELYAAITAGDYARTSMAALATRVGVSRQTLYNTFGDREGLVAALVARENGELLGEVRQELEAHGADLVAGVTAAIDVVLRRASDDPLHKALLGGDLDLLPVFTVHAEPLLRHSAEVLTAYAVEHYPQLDPADVAILTEAVVRLAHSHTVLPGDPPDRVAARIARIVERFVTAASA